MNFKVVVGLNIIPFVFSTTLLLLSYTCIGYVHFKQKNCPLLDLGGFFFRTSTQVKSEKPKASIERPLPVYNTSAEKEAFHIL